MASWGLNQFFSHENQAAPAALSTVGKLRLGVKPDILHCLKSDQPETSSAPGVDSTILDRTDLFQMIHPGTAKTFEEYVNTVFASYISTQLQTSDQT